MKVLLVSSLFFLYYSSYSQAQILEEGDTVVQEIEEKGDVREVTQTTTTVENKTTEDILHADTGIVGNTKHGDMDYDWGGLGPASMPNCDNYFGTGRCGKGTSNSLTTFDQYVDISEFHISDGGTLEWELQMYHSQANTTGYFQTKGYNNNILQWDTGAITLENNQTPTTYSGLHDFAGDLDRVFIRVGGAKNYFFDNVAYTVNYNVITTTVETWVEILQPLQAQEQITQTIVDSYTSVTVANEDSFEEINIDDVVMIDLDMPDMSMPDDFEPGMPETISIGVSEGMFQDMDMGEMSMQEVMVEVETMVAEIQDIGMEVETVEINMPEPQEIKVTAEDSQEPVEVLEQPKIEAQPIVEESAQENVEETVEVANTEMETPEIKEEPKNEVEAEEKTTTSNTVEAKEVNEEPQEKEVVQEEAQEEKQEVKEEPKEEKQVVEEEAKEEPKEVAENKPTKEQEKKQEKAKQIIEGLPNSYDPVSQITTLALVNALGPNITTYQSQVVQVQPTWYVPEDIYTDAILPDPLGSYISVRSNLQIEKMIGQQYE